MKNIQKGSVSTIILLVALLIIGIGFYLYSRNISVSRGNSIELTNIYKTYKGMGVSFEYPSEWKIEEEFYRTPAQEFEGEPATLVSVSVVSPMGERIAVGGRQTVCRESTETERNACFQGLPISTTATSVEVVRVFDHLVSTIKLEN